jgi:drug/metabolite transporter (DMT)-like permease
MFVLFPVVTMLLDVVISGATLTVHGVIGAVMVMSGVWVGALAPTSRRRVTRSQQDLAIEAN